MSATKINPSEQLEATGTPSSTTYLRGDNTWSTPSGGGGSTTPTANTGAEWDSNLNLSANEFLPGTTTNASGGTITMTIASSQIQYFTGSTAATLLLPTTGVNAGMQYFICNQSSTTVTVQSSTGAAVQSVATGRTGIFTAALNTPTTGAHWVGMNWVNGSSFFLPAVSDSLVSVTGSATLTNKTLTAVALSAGTSSAAPLKLASGTNLTTPAAGAIEYDGTDLYFSPAASTRAVVDSEQFITLTTAYTLTSQTGAQKLFNATTNGTVTLPVGTYIFECFFTLSSMSASSGSFGFALGGTATITGQLWESEANKAALATAASAQNTVNTAANTAIATATTTATGWAHINGKVRISASGTLIPEVSLGVAAAAVVGVDSYFRIWLVGSNTVTNIGNWS